MDFELSNPNEMMTCSVRSGKRPDAVMLSTDNVLPEGVTNFMGDITDHLKSGLMVEGWQGLVPVPAGGLRTPLLSVVSWQFLNS